MSVKVNVKIKRTEQVETRGDARINPTNKPKTKIRKKKDLENKVYKKG